MMPPLKVRDRHQGCLLRPRILSAPAALLLGLAVLILQPRSKGGSFGEHSFAGIAFAAGVIAKTYKMYAVAGMIVDPYEMRTVDYLDDCGQICSTKRVCSAFSIKRTADGRVDCRIALGDFKWEGVADWKLFMEDIGLLNGYSLKADGRFYKYVSTSIASRMTLPRSRELCWAEGGDLAVPYPKFRRDAQRQLPLDSNAIFFTGITMPNWSSQRWVTDDGYAFLHNEADPDQPWSPNVGWSDAPIISDQNVTNGWYFVARWEPALRGCACRKDNLYRKLPANGPNTGAVRYYKLHYKSVSADQAARVCASEGGTLANVYVPGVWAAIEGYRMATYMTSTSGQALGKDYWFTVGGRHAGASGGSWILPDGSTFTTNTSDPSQYWASGEPNDGISGGNASLAFMPSGGIGDIPEYIMNPRFLCEIVVHL